MNLKKIAVTVLKTLITVAIFVSLFAEFGGGTVAVSRRGLESGSIFFHPNPAMPGFVGRMKARLTGASLPEPYVPLAGDKACEMAAEGQVYVQAEDGTIVRLKALRHCADGRVRLVLAGPDREELVPIERTSGESVLLIKQGSQRVPLDVKDLWHEVRGLDLSVFLPWLLFATFIKFVGIIANIYRWKVLLAGQGLEFGLGWLTASYFVGRFFGIVMPSTLGLDGWRLYDTIRVSRKPVECTTVLAVERVIGLVGLLASILLFMPFANLEGRGLADVVRAMALPLGAGLLFGLMLLLKPSLFTPLMRLVPVAKVRNFLQSAIESATAYSTRRGALVVALVCAVVGQITTMLMYFANAMALQVENVTMVQVFYASAVMTLGTFLTPTAAGEGVRELVFVELLGGHVPAAKAFLIGHVGFWIEKLLLSFQGGLVLVFNPRSYKAVTYEDLQRLKEETAQEAAAAPAA
jgi:uncharacterized membrane protein YbhN (UPF0104 family)